MNKPISRPITTQRAPAIIRRLPDPTWTGEKQESIIHPEFGGLTFITGFRGKGKSILTQTFDDVMNVVIIDLESKEENSVKEQFPEMGGYFPVLKEMARQYGSDYDLQTVYDRIIQIVDSMPNDRFTVLVVDNAQHLTDGAKHYIRSNPDIAKNRYGIVPQNLAENKYGAANAGANYLINNLYHTVMAKVKCLIVTFQLTTAWENNQPAFNKFKTTEVRMWHELSRLTIALTDPMVEHFPVPRGYVLKESYSQKKWDRENKRFTIIKRIPPALPTATPETIYGYLRDGWDRSNPRPGELVTALEISPFTPTFSNEQLFLAERMAKAQEKLGIKQGGEDE